MLINSDIFNQCSEANSYFYDQKKRSLLEIDRLTKLLATSEYNEQYTKTKLINKETELLNTVSRYEKSIDLYRKKEDGKENTMVQTDIQLDLFQKYEASYNILETANRLV